MITIKVPASTANLGVGFDTLGLALKLYNTLTISTKPKQSLSINFRGEGQDFVSLGEDNLIYRSIKKVFERLGKTIKPNYTINVSNEIPLMGGLGSSSSAIVSGLLAGNVLCGNKLSKEEMFGLAVLLDGHPDNVAPAIFGGFTFSYENLDKSFSVMKLPFPDDLLFIAITPDFRVSTASAREIMPKTYPLPVLVRSNQRLLRFIKAIENKDYKNIEAILKDEIHEPYRLELVPGLKKAKDKAYECGAIAAFISGSGPTLGILAKENTKENTKDIAKDIAKQISQVFGKEGLKSKARFLEIDQIGAKEIKLI